MQVWTGLTSGIIQSANLLTLTDLVATETTRSTITSQSQSGSTSGATRQHSRSGRDHRIDLSTGDRRSTALLFFRPRHELLWLGRGPKILGRQTAAGSHFETTQSMAANGADRSCQARSSLESTTGSSSCPRAGARASQSRHSRSGTQAGSLSARRGQERSALSGPCATRRTSCTAARPSWLKKSCEAMTLQVPIRCIQLAPQPAWFREGLRSLRHGKLFVQRLYNRTGIVAFLGIEAT